MYKKKILVVDDEPQIIKMITTRLMAHGYLTISAGDGKEAVAMARSEHPDLIILDVMMPDMDGAEAAMALKDNVETEDIPIITLTALANENGPMRPGMFGPDVIMAKPFNSRDLLKNVQLLLEDEF